MARQFKPGQLQTGSLFNISSSYALTASFALNGGGGGSSFPYTGSAIISGSLAITGPTRITGSLNITDSIYFSGSDAASRLVWNDIDGTLDLGLKGGNVTLQIGQEQVVRVVNKTGANLLESQYKAIRIRRVDEGGAQGQRLAIVLAQANDDANSVDTLGLVTEDIAVNQEGFITNSGLVRGIDTTGTLQGETWLDGDALYLSPTIAGSITKVKPQAPQHTVTIGYVVYAHANNGTIFVKVDNGYEIDELHNVRITTGSLTSGDLLVYSSSVWINTKQLTGSYNLTGSLTANSFTGSLLGTATSASYINPTFISQSAAASGFGSGGSITYVSSSNNPLSEIEVADYDSNVAVTFVNGRLKFIFGTPTVPSAPVASFNSTFATDRFNKVTDAYTVTGTIAVGGYTLISASLYEGGVLLTSTGSLATQLIYSTTTTGSHTYVLHVTASSPLDNSLNIQSASLSGTLSKTNPGSPTITPTATVQLGSTSNQIEQGATGSITFTSASGTANSWVHNFTSTNVTSPIFVTGSATGSSSITATATSYYSSSGVLGADNSPALTTTSTNSFTYTKIRSLRYGASTATAFTSTELENLATWDTTLGGTVGTVSKGTTTASGQTLTITWTGDKYQYIVFNSSLASLTNIKTSGFEQLSAFTLTTVGQYKVYRSNTLQAGGAGTSITYVLT